MKLRLGKSVSDLGDLQLEIRFAERMVGRPNRADNISRDPQILQKRCYDVGVHASSPRDRHSNRHSGQTTRAPSAVTARHWLVAVAGLEPATYGL